MTYAIDDFTQAEDSPNRWTDARGRLYIGRVGQTLASLVDELNAPPAPVVQPVPQSISDRQFFQQLAVAGIITEDQALASNAAVIPAPLLAIIEAMPTEQQFAAKMLVSGATVFERSHPMTIAIGTAYDWTSAKIDDFFRAAAAL